MRQPRKAGDEPVATMEGSGNVKNGIFAGILPFLVCT